MLQIEKFQNFNIITPDISARIRFNIRETVRQEYAGKYQSLFNELDYLEYLYRQYKHLNQRGGTTPSQKELPCDVFETRGTSSPSG